VKQYGWLHSDSWASCLFLACFLLITVLYLAKGGYYCQLGRSEGLAECTTVMYLHDVAAFFHDIAARQE